MLSTDSRPRMCTTTDATPVNPSTQEELNNIHKSMQSIILKTNKTNLEKSCPRYIFACQTARTRFQRGATVFLIHLPVFALMFSLKNCPLERCWRPKLLAILSHTVPLPEPGGPKTTARKSLAAIEISLAKEINSQTATTATEPRRRPVRRTPSFQAILTLREVLPLFLCRTWVPAQSIKIPFFKSTPKPCHRVNSAVLLTPNHTNSPKVDPLPPPSLWRPRRNPPHNPGVGKRRSSERLEIKP